MKYMMHNMIKTMLVALVIRNRFIVCLRDFLCRLRGVDAARRRASWRESMKPAFERPRSVRSAFRLGYGMGSAGAAGPIRLRP
jgi:hypothetical protein